MDAATGENRHPGEGRPGMPNERTALAWQRTALAVLGGSALMARLTLRSSGPAALLILAVALPLSAWVLVESRLRYRARARQWQVPPRGGLFPTALTLATLAVAAAELVALASG